ncbi:hypothetical protein WJX74_003700 [Apatococcus lobatus]|uniref:Uncharacterized protein n=1 Tax=Apatococcus lobatus TaxID=904363 RepID=A0AAW1SF85_9CHLO
MGAQKVFVVTGANRGIGAEYVRQLLLEKDNYVFATMRNVPTDVTAPIKNLQARYLNEEDDRLALIKLDLTDEASIQAAAAEVEKIKPDGVDYLINNAGIQEGMMPALETSAEDYNRVLRTNVVGPFLVTRAFLPLLKKKQTRTVVNLGSCLGSCTAVAGTITNTNPMHSGFLAYNSSKSAINMQTAVLANQLNAEKFTLISIHPGWVGTDMGLYTAEKLGASKDDPLSPQQSVEGMLKVVNGLSQKDNGRFFDYEGKSMDY